jgi:hypothetical protein
LVTRRVTFEVSTHVSSSAKLAWRNDHQSQHTQHRPQRATARARCASADDLAAAARRVCSRSGAIAARAATPSVACAAGRLRASGVGRAACAVATGGAGRARDTGCAARGSSAGACCAARNDCKHGKPLSKANSGGRGQSNSGSRFRGGNREQLRLCVDRRGTGLGSAERSRARARSALR